MKRIAFLVAALVGTAGIASAAGTTHTMRGVETRLEGAATTLNTETTRLGGTTVTERFATKFDVTTDVLVQQQTQFDVELGDLFLAYSIADASRTTVTVDDIFAMRQEGATWTQIARSLRVPPGRLMRAVDVGITVLTSESGVARTSGRGRAGTHGGSGARSGGTGVTGVDRQIDLRLQTLDDQASRLGDAAISERLSQDFNVSVDVLNQQRTQFNADWGDLLAAYTLQSRASTTITIEEIFALRSSGTSWTQIARSLRVPPGQFLRGIRTETMTLARTSTTTTDETSTTTTTRTHGKGSAAMRGTTAGGTACARTGSGSTRTTQMTAGKTMTSSLKTSTSATLLHGRGAMMRAAARGAMTTRGHK